VLRCLKRFCEKRLAFKPYIRFAWRYGVERGKTGLKRCGAFHRTALSLQKKITQARSCDTHNY